MTVINFARIMCTRVLEVISRFFHKVLDLILFVLSFKVFPLAWHARNFFSFLFRNKLNNRPVPLTTLNTPTVFLPTIWTSNTPLGEIDIMGHKTNSSYATDFDVARNYHLCSLFRVGLKSGGDFSFISPQPRDAYGTGPLFPALGGVNITFHKAIRPRQKYEISTRVLSWDDKWIHLISHFVERGSCKPVHFTDQRNPQRDPEMNIGDLTQMTSADQHPSSRPVVYATAMAKIVFKKGRKTVPPPQFLVDCGLLPGKEKVVLHGSIQNACEEEKVDDNDMTKIRDDIEEIRTAGYEMAERLNTLAEGESFYNMSEKVFFSKR